MGKCWDKECGECVHIDFTKGCHWGFPCAKTNERKQAFTTRNKGMGFMDMFRFSPDLWVRKGWKACQFFEYNQLLDADTKYSGDPDKNPRKDIDVFHAPML